MKRLFPSTQYRKDYKRYRNNPIKVAALKEVLDMLANEQPIPAEYLPHPLHGNYKGCIECHIQGDWLLIYKYQNDELILSLTATGTHSDLF
jgi:mRNA interferase YafQ